VPLLRCQRRPPPAPRAGLQSRQLHADAGDQPGPTDQWGLSRQDAAPRNPHHCSTNCRDTTAARNTPWMGNKGRDIPEPDILRAVGMVKHCNTQHSAVLALGRMGGRMPRDQPAEPRPGLFRSHSLQSFHCSPQAFLEEIGQQSRHTRLSGILSSPCHSDPVSDFMCRNDSCPKTHAESGYSRAKPPGA